MTTPKRLKVLIPMIENVQCPGCVVGSDTKCGSFKLEPDCDYGRCIGHVSGTSMLTGRGPMNIALGLPAGFNKEQRPLHDGRYEYPSVRLIRCWAADTHPGFDHLNVPVWALDGEDGNLYVRTFMPRLNMGAVDVISGARRADHCPQAIDVASFANEID